MGGFSDIPIGCLETCCLKPCQYGGLFFEIFQWYCSKWIFLSYCLFRVNAKKWTWNFSSFFSFPPVLFKWKMSTLNYRKWSLLYFVLDPSPVWSWRMTNCVGRSEGRAAFSLPFWRNLWCVRVTNTAFFILISQQTELPIPLFLLTILNCWNVQFYRKTSMRYIYLNRSDSKETCRSLNYRSSYFIKILAL